MLRFGARKWLPFIIISWGVFATAMALISDATRSFNVLRFLLGVPVLACNQFPAR
jgi:MFS transporter, ACS family, tartrate transporter